MNFTSPNHDGPRPRTLGVVVHSTRGGASSLRDEFTATVNWFNNPASQVSAHAVVGPGGLVSYPVDPLDVAWHARSYNQDHLGIELAQPHPGDPISPDILDLAARIVAGWAATFNFPIRWDLVHGLAEHWEIPPGIADGKTDIRFPFDRDDFLKRVHGYAVAATLNRAEIGSYATWVLASLANGPEEVRGTIGLDRFVAHLTSIGADGRDPARYGWPA